MIETKQGRGVFWKLQHGLEFAINILIGFMLAGMVVVVFGNVIFRYFLNASLAWSEEVSRFMLIWLVFMGAVIAYIRNEHLGLDIMLKVLPPLGSRILAITADALVVTALIVMTRGGIVMTADSFASGWVAASLPIPYGYVYMATPIATGLMLIESVIKLVSDIRKLITTARGGA
jgi:TRAP-type C4-dicarboxylate transport system permease small subunit